jgi:hypothetical protein
VAGLRGLLHATPWIKIGAVELKEEEDLISTAGQAPSSVELDFSTAGMNINAQLSFPMHPVPRQT